MIDSEFVFTVLIIVILNNVNLIGQDIQYKAWNNIDTSYEATTTFPTDAVADDFGPRRITTNYHLGIDYNSEQDDGNDDKWDLILAPEAGTIVDVNRLWTTEFRVYTKTCGIEKFNFPHL